MEENPEANVKFEDRIPCILKEIEKRKSKHFLTTVDFDDIRQELLIRVFNKYHLYDFKKAKFTHWVNTVISNGIKNIYRKNLTKFSRPCILGCKMNMGGEFCSYTKSGKQCEECPLYAKWKEKKESHFAVKQTLALDNHIQEVNNIQSDFMNIDNYKKIIDTKIKCKLTENEYLIYKFLYIENLEPEEVGKRLNYKVSENSSIPGYQIIIKAQKKFVSIAREILREEL